jgi:hypothetical protein
LVLVPTTEGTPYLILLGFTLTLCLEVMVVVVGMVVGGCLVPCTLDTFHLIKVVVVEGWHRGLT